MAVIFNHYDTVQGQTLIELLNEDYCLRVVQGLQIWIEYLNNIT